MSVVGVATDGKPVVDFFRLIDTHGLPLDLVLDLFQENNYVPDWTGFWEHSIRLGWNPKSTRIKLEMAISVVYGSEYLTEWQLRMDLYLKGTAP